MTNVSAPHSYPVLPLRDIVVFPSMIVPLFVGRDKSVAALEAAMASDKEIFLVAQLDPAQDDPARDDLAALLYPAASTSVRAKSLPLNSSGRPRILARA